MYILSSEEAMGNFMKNPRLYLLPPQPRPPVKLVVTGPPLSGKTSLCHLLAQKYGATVLNMDELIQPKLEEERANMLQQVRDEATENAIIMVKQRLKEQMDVEAAQKEETTEEEQAPGDKGAEGRTGAFCGWFLNFSSWLTTESEDQGAEKQEGEEESPANDELKTEEATTAGTEESSKEAESESAKPPTEGTFHSSYLLYF